MLRALIYYKSIQGLPATVAETPILTFAAMAHQLRKGSKAVRHLQHLFMSGAIDRSEDPKKGHEVYSVFQQHKIAKFRTCYNNLKKEFGVTHQGKLTYLNNSAF